jgi:hypothetical protein
MQYAKMPQLVTRFLTRPDSLFPPLAPRLFVDTDALEHHYLAPVVSNVRYTLYIFDVLTLDMP